MRIDFVILSVIGWVWAALVGLFLLIRLRFESKNGSEPHIAGPSDTSHLG